MDHIPNHTINKDKAVERSMHLEDIRNREKLARPVATGRDILKAQGTGRDIL